MPRSDLVGDFADCQSGRQSRAGNPPAGRLFARIGGAVSDDVAFDGALPEVLQPLSFPYACARSGVGRPDDRPRRPAGDRPLYPDLELAVFLKSVRAVRNRSYV